MTTASEDAIVDLLERAAEQATAGDVAGAGALAAEAAALQPSGDPDRLDTFVFAAQLLDSAGQHEAAADAWAAAALEPQDDAGRARALTAEGESSRLAGQWGRAVDSHRLALTLAESTLGESVETASIAQNLAMVFKYTGRFDDAEVLYLRALAIAEAAGEHRLVAVICHNLGGLAHARGDHAIGIPWARRSIEVRATLDDPVALATDRGALAGLLIDAGEIDEAAVLLRTARDVFVAHLGDGHHEVAVVDGNLATIALRTGDLHAAEHHARAALAGKERHLGPQHPELAVTLTTLGTIRRRLGDAAAAVKLHRRALDLLAPSVEPGHPLLAAIEENLAIATEEAATPRPRRTGRRRTERRTRRR